MGIEENINSVRLLKGCQWGQLNIGQRIKKGKALFPRIEAASATEVSDVVTIEDFAKVKLRIGKIISAENVPGSKKLLKLVVDIGDEKRQVVAGIAVYYRPEEIVGKSVVIVANLKPAKLMGIESQGMILAASKGDTLSLISPDKDIPSGAVVK